MSKKRNLQKVFSILMLAILACARTPELTPTMSNRLTAGESTRSLNHGSLDRSYILYTPASINWSQPVSVVLVFHGGTGNAKSAIRMSGFNEVADQKGFIVVYPNGTGRLSSDKLLTWNGGTCCGYAQEKNIDDVGFVRAIIADLQSVVNIDTDRIYATGMSNGGILAYRLACEAADLIAAVAPVAGTLNFSPCDPSRPVSVIDFHGTADQHILYEGGFGPESLVNVNFTSVTNSVEFWITIDGCNLQPRAHSFDDIQHETWTGCEGSTDVELYTIIGGGHAWPGGQGGWTGADQPTDTISASQLIWEFFDAHPKP
jgi:polyhydroxybutyrate depolymerase